MKTLQAGDSRVSKIIQSSKIDLTSMYRPSQFLYSYSDKNGHCLYNTLSKTAIQLSDEEWNIFLEIKQNGMNGEDLSRHAFAQLAKMRFLVPDETDDFKLYGQVITLLRTMSFKSQPGIKQYTILPTTFCNAQCVYCFEEGMRFQTMSTDTAERVVEFIDQTHMSGQPCRLIWFGGEPLVAHRIISHICQKLTDRKIAYTSELVTNAMLFDAEIIKTAKEIWHVDCIQVSVDGNREDYETRKAYISPAIHNYDKLFSVLSLLLEESFKVVLRCNYDEKNLNGIKEFIDDIYNKLGNPKNLAIYFGMLIQMLELRSSVEVYSKVHDLMRYLDEKGMPHKFTPSCHQQKSYFCMADSRQSIIINPNGSLQRCETVSVSPIIGNIEGEKLPSLPESSPFTAPEKCRTCCFLPHCTTFRKENCPATSKYCNEFNCITYDYFLEKQLLTKPE